MIQHYPCHLTKIFEALKSIYLANKVYGIVNTPLDVVQCRPMETREQLLNNVEEGVED